ncbi:MAG: DNA polymerase/3'-5' exonuclease PolX [Ignavibacteriales bacterium]|nr:DNA polymerase/3'-5' exonuclease PolX [Ignavibacteriales bacterium]
MDKKQVAAVLDQMGTLLELQNANPFRIRAFQNASQIIEGITEDLDDLVDRQTLTDIDGIGQGLAKIITDLVKTGSSREYEDLRKSLPAGLLDIIRIPGLGPKRVRLLYEKLKIDSVEALKRACETHQLAELTGFGEKTEQNILRGIERLRKTSEKHLVPRAAESAEKMLKAISRLKAVKRCEVAGSLRRRKEVIGDIDIVASVEEKHRASIVKVFVSQPEVSSVVAQGETKATVVLTNGINCDLRLVRDNEYPFALNYFTGSKEHNVEMRSLARRKGWSLNEYSFSLLKGAKKQSRIPVCRNEEDIYKALGLSYVPPELRENMGEFDASRKGAVPKLLEEKNLRGTFHVHSTYSDGANSLEELTKAAQKLGWDYWGVADHSQIAVYAQGLSPEKVNEQRREIENLNARLKNFRVFHGTECDILSDGTLDYSNDVLAGFEYVVASIHSKFNMNESEGTKRLIKAVRNKYVTMIGHPTGRVLLSRDGYPCDMVQVIDAMADYGKAIELNAHPSRLDPDWRLLKYAKEKGVKVFINPDAHNADGLRDVRYGVGVARKAWLEARDVGNAWPTREVEKFFAAIRA